MNKIDVSNIVDPNQAQPLFGKSLKFLQDSISDQLQGLAWAIIGNSVGQSNTYIISALEPDGNKYGTGYILYQGELFYCPGKTTTTPFSNVPILTLSDTPDTSIDPTQFSNGVNFNVHKIRQMILSDGTSGSGTIDLSACIRVNDLWHNIGDPGEPAFQNSWVNSGVTGVAPARFKRVGNSVYLGGIVSSGASASIAFQLPIGYRPIYVQEAITAVEGVTGANAAANFTVDNNGNITLTYPSSRSYICLDNMFFNLD